MQTKFTPYPLNLLPNGFKYPEKYLQLSDHLYFSDAFIWWFEDADTEGGKLAWKLRLSYREWKNIGERNLIPFAQLNDDAAFFDGDDTSGDPKVIVIDLGNKQRMYELDNFDIWLREALVDSGVNDQ